MKQHVTMSIDAEIVIEAKKRLGNLSGFVEDYLRLYLDKKPGANDLEALKKKLADQKALTASVQQEIDIVEAAEKKRKEKEEFERSRSRWL